MWGVVRRALAACGLAAALVGFAAFAGAAGGAWWLRGEADRRTDAVASKAGAALDAADHAVSFVSGVVDQGERDLLEARNQPAEGPREPVNPFVQIGARQASEKLAGSVERANAAVAAASDAVVVAEAALRLFEEDRQVKEWFPVEPGQLSRTRSDLSAAARELRNVRTILGVPVSGWSPTEEQLLTVEAALRQARALVARMAGVVAAARAKVSEAKQTADEWTRRLALAVTAAGVLGAAGQFFTARFCWRVLRGKPA